MSLSPAFLDELRMRTTLSSVIGRHVKLRKAGREWKACCPFHKEKTPSFTVNDEKAFYHCFGCGAHGDAIRYITETRGLAFIDAVKELADAAGMAMPAPDPQQRERQEQATGLRDVTEAAALWFADQLRANVGIEARAYLERRGLDMAAQGAFRLGFAPDSRGAIVEGLKEYPRDQLIEAGLVIQPDDAGRDPYDRFRGRLIFPIRDPRGRVIAFGGRIIGDGEPKYLNSPDTPLFDKGRTLFNLDRAAPASRSSGRIIVVEGYMDVIALDSAGIGEVVAPLGTALTEHQIPLLWRLSDEPIVCFDGDAAGQKAAARAADRALSIVQPGKSLRFAALPPGEDPDDLLRRAGRKAFEAVIAAARPMSEMLYASQRDTDNTATPEGRAGLKVNLDALAAKCQNAEIAREYRRAFSAFFYDEFGWRKSERKEIEKAIIGSGPHGRRELMPLYTRSMLYGLSRFPAMLGANSETIARVEIAEHDFERWREVLLNATFARPNLDSDAVRAILDASDLSQTARFDLRHDLRFPWVVGIDAAARKLTALIELLGEECALDQELGRLNVAMAADSSLEAYDRIESERERLRGKKRALYDSNVSDLLEDEEQEMELNANG